MSIHELYGRLAEQLERTEANRKFLYELVLQLQSGAVKLEQVEIIEGGGFKVNPLPEEEVSDGESQKL